MTKEQIQKSIDDMAVYVPIYKIEETLEMPPTTLQKVLSGTRDLPKKWNKPLEAYFAPQKDVKIQNINEQTNKVKDLTATPPKTNYSVNTESNGGAFMNEAIKKKLGIK